MNLKDFETTFQEQTKARNKRVLIVLGIIFSVITAKHILGLIITSILSLVFIVAFVWLRYKKRKKWLETDIKTIAAKRRVESDRNA
ncbi:MULTISPECIES: hypothetical protein [Streptococcus]|uniref:hypothetical protein n=1 Tax=Streptococcus TaxID=1301 RepID=UPI000310B14F|nr:MULTISPECIES: hypothetical protein [Streptococcus]EPW98345.1 hypothetical protein SAG0140_11645 [Streptococcus agalactiae MRI Z1-022]PHV60780.1 hypothetical protein CS005_00050 [Streptococcus macedonicus]PJH77954.1 hypothetical protein CV715_01840 [Streptococcus thermophilus]